MSNTTRREHVSSIDRRRARAAPSQGAGGSVDWNRFTNFRSRNTRKDLERLLSSVAKSKSRRKDALEQPDKAGLYPIHWAAINNRSDMIESLYEAGSPLAKPCRNRLFANGTPLHLAAMNGSLEAAAMLLSKSHELQSHKTRPKSLASRDETPSGSNIDNNNQNTAQKNPGRQPTKDDDNDNDDKEEEEEEEEEDDDTKKMLEARDADGQTPLMRAAAPRSKRMDAIRDLLRKNFWSLSGRPAEMALLLICMGADWRLTEPQNGMNLLHLAIVNDYDDIVSLLLVLDKDLIDTPTQSRPTHRPARNRELKNTRDGRGEKTNEISPEKEISKTDNNKNEKMKSAQPGGFVDVNLKSPSVQSTSDSNSSSNVSSSAAFEAYTDDETTPTTTPRGQRATNFSKRYRDRATSSDNESTPSSSPSAIKRPLISERRHEAAKEATANRLLAAGLQPLQLAILYGRISAISQLWRISQLRRQQQQQQSAARGTREGNRVTEREHLTVSQIEAQREALRGERRSTGNAELKRILIRACYSNKLELAKFLKPALLKGALVLDLALLVLVWAPSYASSSGLAGGLFFVSFVLTVALALRATLKNPGYLRRNSIQYLSELAKLLEGKSVREAPSNVIQLRRGAAPTRQNSPATEREQRPDRDGSESQAVRRRSATHPLIRLEAPDNTEDKSSRSSEAPPEVSKPAPASGPQTGADDASERQQVSKSARRVVGLVSCARPAVDAFRDLQDKVRLFCHKCQCVRRPRSRHCNSCNHCVQDFDHHCIYLGCCIGRHNRLDFVAALIALAITAIYGTILQTAGAAGDTRRGAWHLVAFVWIFKYALIGGLGAFLNLRRAAIGVTLYEEIRSKRIRRTFGRSGPPEEISQSHRAFSTTLKGSFWRYAPDRFLTGDLAGSQLLANLREFTNYISPGEYLLTFVSTDTPLARSLASSDSRIKQLYKFV